MERMVSGRGGAGAALGGAGGGGVPSGMRPRRRGAGWPGMTSGVIKGEAAGRESGDGAAVASARSSASAGVKTNSRPAANRAMGMGLEMTEVVMEVGCE